MKARRFLVNQISPSYDSKSVVIAGEESIERVSPTMFSVELNSVVMSGVKIVHGNLWITLDTVEDLTGENYVAIRQKLIEMGVLSDYGFLDTTQSVGTEESLDRVKDARWADIVAIRDGLEVNGFPYLEKWFDSDERSVARINTTAQAAIGAAMTGVDFSTTWVCADNTSIVLTRDQIIGLPAAFAQYCSVLHSTARDLRARIYSSNTNMEVMACKWDGVEDV